TPRDRPFTHQTPHTTRTYPLSLHDALPISPTRRCCTPSTPARPSGCGPGCAFASAGGPSGLATSATSRASSRRPRDRQSGPEHRSEEHTSELQSRGHLVCRLLLEKKKKVQ